MCKVWHGKKDSEGWSVDRMKYDTGDGWDLRDIAPLSDFMQAYDDMRDNIYELKNCVRTKSLVQMRDELFKCVEEMQEALDSIGDDDE